MDNKKTDRYEVLISFKTDYNGKSYYEPGIIFTGNNMVKINKETTSLVDSSVRGVYIYDRVSRKTVYNEIN